MKELKEFCQIIVEAGGNSQVYRQLPPVLYREGASFEMHLTSLNGLPTVTGILVLDANVAGIYHVATLPSKRKNGYASAMIEYLLAQAKAKGYSLSTLQASHQGKNLYERLGFKPCCVFKEYAETPASFQIAKD